MALGERLSAILQNVLQFGRHHWSGLPVGANMVNVYKRVQVSYYEILKLTPYLKLKEYLHCALPILCVGTAVCWPRPKQ